MRVPTALGRARQNHEAISAISDRIAKIRVQFPNDERRMYGIFFRAIQGRLENERETNKLFPLTNAMRKLGLNPEDDGDIYTYMRLVAAYPTITQNDPSRDSMIADNPQAYEFISDDGFLRSWVIVEPNPTSINVLDWKIESNIRGGGTYLMTNQILAGVEITLKTGKPVTISLQPARDGIFVWARMGFNAPFNEVQQAILRDEGFDAKDVNELMLQRATTGRFAGKTGEEAWNDLMYRVEYTSTGRPVRGEFDIRMLHDKLTFDTTNPRSLQVLEQFVRAYQGRTAVRIEAERKAREKEEQVKQRKALAAARREEKKNRPPTPEEIEAKALRDAMRALGAKQLKLKL